MSGKMIASWPVAVPPPSRSRTPPRPAYSGIWDPRAEARARQYAEATASQHALENYMALKTARQVLHPEDWTQADEAAFNTAEQVFKQYHSSAWKQIDEVRAKAKAEAELKSIPSSAASSPSSPKSKYSQIWTQYLQRTQNTDPSRFITSSNGHNNDNRGDQSQNDPNPEQSVVSQEAARPVDDRTRFERYLRRLSQNIGSEFRPGYIQSWLLELQEQGSGTRIGGTTYYDSVCFT